jgi:8-amino-7-oxononanoate synthase
MSWRDWVQGELADVRSEGRWRALHELDAAEPAGRLSSDGRRVVCFASNDYLGLTTHPAVAAAAHAAIERWGTGSGASRLVVGSRPVHSELEAELADWKGTERALVFPTGYAANLGVLTTFGPPEAVICSDELNHASIIDGCRLARARVAVYPHRDHDAVEDLLAGAARRAVVVTDAVFSMDGDAAAVGELADLCARYEALLVIDEAHAVLAEAPRLEGGHVLRVGTLSKTLGALGGFVAGDTASIELLVNRARPFIFTTALSPADAAAALAALRVLRSGEGEALRRRLRGHVDGIRPGHPSPIIPFILGSEERATAAAIELLGRGLLVPAIRPPTVPPGTSRLRVTLSAAHTDPDVASLATALDELGAGQASLDSSCSPVGVGSTPCAQQRAT